MKEVSNFRSTLQNQVRTHARDLLCGVTNMSMEEINDAMQPGQHADNAEFKVLLGYQLDTSPGAPLYAFMPPILLGGPDSDDELDRMFKSPIIEKVCSIPVPVHSLLTLSDIGSYFTRPSSSGWWTAVDGPLCSQQYILEANGVWWH
jgi:hypothetical protein